MSRMADKAKAVEKQSPLWLTLFLCAGVLLSFTAFGYAQEAVTRTEWGEAKDRFTETSFLVLIQCTCNMIVSGALLTFTSGGKPNFTAGVPVQEWLVVALGYLGAHQFGLMALRYIIFPLQVQLHFKYDDDK